MIIFSKFVFFFSTQMGGKNRKSYTVKEKLAVLKMWRESSENRSKFAAKRGMNESTLRPWLSQEQRLRAVPTKKIKRVRYMNFSKKSIL